MKSQFIFNNVWYLAPTKREARRFIRLWSDDQEARRFEALISRLYTTWKINHVELAPSYAQMMSVDLSKVEYRKT